MSVLLLLMGREMDQCQGGILQGKIITLIQSKTIIPTHASVVSAFAKLLRKVV